MQSMFRICLIAFLLIAVRPSFAEDAKASPSLDLNALGQNFNILSQENSSKREEFTKETIQYLERLPTAIADALQAKDAEKAKRAAEEMAFNESVSDLALERSRSVHLSYALADHLNDVNLQTILLYKTVQDQSLGSQVNPLAGGRSVAYADLFRTYVDLFCVPGPFKPEGCGQAREDYGIDNGESFVDFFISEKTWPQRAVLDAMKLARSFFAGLPPKIFLENVGMDPQGMVELQKLLTQNNLKMAIINHLAARRGPTSAATYGVMLTAFKNFLPMGQISSLDYAAVCDKKLADQTSAEQYVCSFTNKPENAGDPRIISQAALDRLTQYDFYMNGSFSGELQSPKYGVAGPLDKLEIYIAAQRLTQDYQQLQLLQMTTAAKAMNIMNSQGSGTPGSMMTAVQ